MPDAQARHTPAAGGGLVQAAHAARAAEAALATGHATLDWAALCAWPDWALDPPTPATRRRWQRLGALWHAPALRRCIDGRCLQAAEALLGPATLQAVIDHAPAGAAAMALPPPAALAEHWQQCGRAIALAALPTAALRAAVAAASGDGATLRGFEPATAAALCAWVDARPGDAGDAA